MINKIMRHRDMLCGLASLLIAIVGLFQPYEIFTRFILSVYGILFLVWYGFREYVLSRKARFAEAAAPISECYTHLKIATEAIEQSNQDLAYTHIEGCLKSFANAFSMITGVHCRACIKSVDVNEAILSEADKSAGQFDHAYVTKTFCRGSSLGADIDDVRVPISHNSDFEILTKERTRRYWLSNDISRELGYSNSSLRHLTDTTSWKQYFKTKQCKYISTIIWPISVITPTKRKEPDDFVGFLCIDSKTRGVFNTNFDVELGFGLAEVLFPVLYDYSQIITPIEQGTTKCLPK